MLDMRCGFFFFFFFLGKEVVDCVIGTISVVDPNLLQQSAQYTFTTPTKSWSKDLKCHWKFSKVISFKLVLSFSLANKGLAITLALTNVNFRLGVTWSMLSPLTLKPTCGGNCLVKVIKMVKIAVDPNLESKKHMCVIDLEFCLCGKKTNKNSKVHRIGNKFQLSRHCKLGLGPTTSLKHGGYLSPPPKLPQTFQGR